MTDSLHTKRKSQMSDKERIQDFQRKLYRKAKQEQEFKRKSQRASRLYRRKVFEELVSRCGLIDPTKMLRFPAPVKVLDEACRKAVCGKTACTV